MVSAKSSLVHCNATPAESHSNWTDLIREVITSDILADRLEARISLIEEMPLDDELTIVTGYINIGDFQKGAIAWFTPQLYRHWLKIFSRISNPVVAFFDNPSDAARFKVLRSNFPPEKTQVHVISRREIWAFNNLYPKIKDIYSKPDYPKHPPNTVLPEYSCVMHAKYEFMLRAIYNNPFNTLYFAWLDVGLFRTEVDREDTTEPFELYIPQNMDQYRVAYTKIYHRVPSLPTRDIFFDNYVWVCGCFFVGRASIMIRWVTEYMKYADYFLCQNIMNTDQQVLYAMFNIAKPEISIQEYRPPEGTENPWFYLGYLSKDAGKKRQKGGT